MGSSKKVAAPLLPYLMPSRLTPESGAAAALEIEQAMANGGAPELASVAMRLRKTADTAALLARARVVGATCAALTFPVMDALNLPIVILDECSQLPELTALLPLRFGGARLLAVGDPQQLPPVLASPPLARVAPATAGSPTLESSTLFERLARLGWPVQVMRTQYRCPPQLSALASRLFYGGRLRDGPRPVEAVGAAPSLPSLVFVDYGGELGSLAHALTGPRCVWDARMCERVEGSGSIANVHEATLVAEAVVELLNNGVPPAAVGIICLYKAQVGKVSQALDAAAGRTPAQAAKRVLVSTVDAFQGQERAFILVSPSRTTSAAAGGGHVDDPRRMCVTLTRATRSLIVIGCARALAAFHVWTAVLGAAASAGGLRSAALRPLLSPPPVAPPPAARTTSASASTLAQPPLPASEEGFDEVLL
jgi:superfamily I DNA and/or RNA helicase